MNAGADIMQADRSKERSSRPSRISLLGLYKAAPAIAFIALWLASLAWAYNWILTHHGALGFDFEGTLWEPGIAIREGRGPYPPPTIAEVEVGNPAIYPPLLMVLVAPFTVLPWGLALALWTALLAASIVAALRLLEVRDLRCYALALACAPVLSGFIWSNATLLLVPLVALAWRWRDRALGVGIVVGLSIATKFLLWPLLFWLIATRRYRASATAAVAVCAGVLVPWALIGFQGISTYPDLLRVAESVFAEHSYSLATMLSAVDAGSALVTVTAPLVALGGVALVLWLGRRGRDQAALSLAVLASILGSPIVWEYYYALVLVPLAIARPRFSAAWLILPAFYLTHKLPRPHLTSADIEPGGFACCPPDGVPFVSWVFNHAPGGLWPAVGHALIAVVFIAVAIRSTQSRPAAKELG